MVPRLIFDEVAPGRDFHAALIAAHARSPSGQVHTHDFAEMMYVGEGSGQHWINGEQVPLRAGDLLWITPEDRHTVTARPGEGLQFINVAFRLAAWADFRRAAGLTDLRLTHRPVEAERRAQAAAAFDRALRGFHTAPTRFALCRFWAEALPLLTPEPTDDRDLVPGPPWLQRACRRMVSPDNLHGGVPRLTELCGVSPAHLSRTLKAATGQTPTDWVNALRLRRAETLLLTTPQEIAEIALDCGFENLSHFYRLFRRRTGLTPRAYRWDARRRVVPPG